MIRLVQSRASGTIAPHDLAAEMSVLGAALQDPEAARKAAGMLRVSDFFRDDHAEILGAVQSLVARREPVNPLSVYRELRGRGEKAREIGATYLTGLVEHVPTAANVVQHCRFVRQDADKRRLLDLCAKAQERIKTDGANLGDLVGDLREALNGIGAMQGMNRAPLVRASEIHAECQRSPYTEPPGSGMLSHQGHPT